MGILDAYQESTDTALNVMASMPLEIEKPAPKNSAWSAPFRAVASGAAEVAGNVIDTASAFGQVTASVGGITPGFDPDAKKNRQSSVEAYDKLKTDGIDWRTEEGKQAYKFGADLRPDPLTAGTAENIVFGLTKGLTKAIGSAATFGPMGGAAAFGVSEGMTASEDLANQGVDQATRMKVGSVTGMISTIGVALPVAGNTVAQTAGLVVVGGPASFMVQQQATRTILENADYGNLAKQYDPLDPVGLTIATLLPAGFAAYAKRGGFAAKPLQAPDATPIQENAAAMQETVPVATNDAIDAAMVHNLTARVDAHETFAPANETPIARESDAQSFPEKDFTAPEPVAQDITPDGYTARVDIPDFDDFATRYVESKPIDTFDYKQKISEAEAEIRKDYENGGIDAGPIFKKMTEENADYFDEDGDLTDAGYKRFTEIQDEFVRLAARESVGEPQQKITDFSDPADAAQLLREYFDAAGLSPNEVGGSSKSRSKYFQIENGKRMIRVSDHELPDHYVNDSDIEVLLPSNSNDALAKLKEVAAEIVKDAPTPNSALTRSSAPESGMQERTVRAVDPGSSEPAQYLVGAGSSSKITPDDVVLQQFNARVEALTKEQPDLIARLDDSGQPVKLSDDLAAIKKEAQEGTDTDFGAMDAPLLKVAVECALSIGVSAL